MDTQFKVRYTRQNGDIAEQIYYVNNADAAKASFLRCVFGRTESNILDIVETTLPTLVKRTAQTDTRHRDTWAARAYATLLDFRGTPQTKDAILARMNEVFEFNSAQHNSVAPTFSPGNGGLWDEQRAVLVSRKRGVTRTGKSADEWVADEFATQAQKEFSIEEWERVMDESLADMKQALLDLPSKIAAFERAVELRKNTDASNTPVIDILSTTIMAAQSEWQEFVKTNKETVL